jgi:hypothetical protein
MLPLALGIAALLSWWGLHRRTPHPIAAVIPSDSGRPITVEVLNETPVDGLARDVARKLRGRGIDVVSIGTSGRRDRDSTAILLRRGDTATATAVKKALGVGRISRELDPHRLLDASVLIGRDLVPALNRHP